MRILLADDSEDNRLLVRSYLRGHEVDEAKNGEVAVSKFTAGRYHLVLMDVQMPVMDGHAATAAMRAWEQERGVARTPILALTANGLAEENRKSLEAGCDDHLTKPIGRATLLAAIARHVPASLPAAGAAAVRVRLDESLRDLAPGYLDNRRKDLARLAAALAAGDWETVRVVGHNMKGTGAGYGFAAVSEIGAALERAGRDGDAVRAAGHADELRRYLDGIVVEFG